MKKILCVLSLVLCSTALNGSLAEGDEVLGKVVPKSIVDTLVEHTSMEVSDLKSNEYVVVERVRTGKFMIGRFMNTYSFGGPVFQFRYLDTKLSSNYYLIPGNPTTRAALQPFLDGIKAAEQS